MIGATMIATDPWSEKGKAMLYTFGDYELDMQRYELRCAGKLLKIEPQVFDVLVYLIQHRDRTVARQELIEHLWPEQYISDAVLSYCIMAARKAVGDSGRMQRIIKTVHGRGFRFVVPLQERDHAPSAPEGLTTTVTPGHTETQQSDSALLETAPYAAASPLHADVPLGASPLMTVLCATLSNVTVLDDQLGFDALQRLRQAFFALAQQLAQHYQGTLQFFGADGILVLFGGMDAGADHARRAVLAALELQRRLLALYPDCGAAHVTRAAVRMAIHSGLVAIDRLADAQPIATTTMGETMHLATWLQYVTEPGTLLTSEATVRLLQGEVRYTARREVHVPGQPHPVTTYTICSVQGV
jgi:DNA-binding winged helix-turn-helix (wHTH) protein